MPPKKQNRAVRKVKSDKKLQGTYEQHLEKQAEREKIYAKWYQDKKIDPKTKLPVDNFQAPDNLYLDQEYGYPAYVANQIKNKKDVMYPLYDKLGSEDDYKKLDDPRNYNPKYATDGIYNDQGYLKNNTKSDIFTLTDYNVYGQKFSPANDPHFASEFKDNKDDIYFLYDPENDKIVKKGEAGYEEVKKKYDATDADKKLYQVENPAHPLINRYSTVYLGDEAQEVLTKQYNKKSDMYDSLKKTFGDPKTFAVGNRNFLEPFMINPSSTEDMEKPEKYTGLAKHIMQYLVVANDADTMKNIRKEEQEEQKKQKGGRRGKMRGGGETKKLSYRVVPSPKEGSALYKQLSNMESGVDPKNKFDAVSDDLIRLTLMKDVLPIEGNGKIKMQITNKDFADKGGLIMFHTPDCMNCVRFMPQYYQLAKMLRGQCPVGTVDCLDKMSGNKILADYLGIRGYPEIKYYNKGKFIDYSGGDSLKELLSFICTVTGKCDFA